MLIYGNITSTVVIILATNIPFKNTGIFVEIVHLRV